MCRRMREGGRVGREGGKVGREGREGGREGRREKGEGGGDVCVLENNLLYFVFECEVLITGCRVGRGFRENCSKNKK